jgi:P27 family predicted phage terminase small subunit
MLASYCDAWSRWSQATTELQAMQKKKGTSVLVVGTKTGYPMQNPLIGIINTAADQMRKFGAELGLSPSSRTRLSVEPLKQTKEDEFAISRPRNFVRPTSIERRDFGLHKSEASVQPILTGTE